MITRIILCIVSMVGGVQDQAVALRAIVQAATRLQLDATEIKPTPPREDWSIGMVSWVAADRNGLIDLLQRGDHADPIVVMNHDGKVVRSWGAGMFVMPHSIQIDEDGIIDVADRENGRVQRFTHGGAYLGEWAAFGKTFGLTLAPGALWLATQPRSEPNGSPGWLMKVDRNTGAVLGYVEVTGVHSAPRHGRTV